MTGSDWVQLAQVLVWPAFLAVLLIIFRQPLRRFANRVTSVRVAGQEFVAQTLDTSQIVLHSLPTTAKLPEAVPRGIEQDVLRLACSDPQSALIKLSREIDRAVRRLSAAGNWLEPMERQPSPQWRRLVLLSQSTGWDADVLASMLMVSLLMQAGVDGHDGLSDKDLRRVIDQGLTILGLVNAHPREIHKVLSSSLTIYEDREMNSEIPGKLAVLLSSRQADGSEVVRALYTSRPKFYRPDMSVSWEWRENPPKEEFPGWAVHPTTNEPMHVIGWDFHGRDMSEFD